MKAIWGRLPGAIGDFAFQAANRLIGGVEAMLNGVVTRINSFISALNGALDLLPDWATGEGGVRIGTSILSHSAGSITRSPARPRRRAPQRPMRSPPRWRAAMSMRLTSVLGRRPRCRAPGPTVTARPQAC